MSRFWKHGIGTEVCIRSNSTMPFHLLYNMKKRALHILNIERRPMWKSPPCKLIFVFTVTFGTEIYVPTFSSPLTWICTPTNSHRTYGFLCSHSCVPVKTRILTRGRKYNGKEVSVSYITTLQSFATVVEYQVRILTTGPPECPSIQKDRFRPKIP
jgi:hypothetical protein